ncbi:MAG: helix-turn-helix domain-containing protein [Solirubrobacteraceae bacterium]
MSVGEQKRPPPSDRRGRRPSTLLTIPADRPERAEIRRVFGENVRRLRTGAGLSQTQLARLVGVGHDTISHIERGSQPPHFFVSLMLADKLSVSVGALFAGVPAPRFDASAERIFAVVSETPRLTTTALAERTGLSPAHIKPLTARLAGEGRLVQRDGWCLARTKKGSTT